MSAAHLVGIRGVTLRGLSSRQDLNGTEVDVQSYSEPRYVVLLADGTSIRVKPENLIVKAVGNDSCFATQKHGEMLESIGRYDEAADVYREILHGSEAGSLSHPGVEAVIWNNIGLAHKRGMRFKRAKMAYLECIAACTDQGPKETIIAMLAKMINQYDALDEPPLPAGHPDALEGDLQAEFFSILSTLFDPYRPAGHYKISQGFDLVSPESRRLANRDYFMAVSYAPPRLDAVWVYSFVDDPNGKKRGAAPDRRGGCSHSGRLQSAHDDRHHGGHTVRRAPGRGALSGHGPRRRTGALRAGHRRRREAGGQGVPEGRPGLLSAVA